MITTKYCGFDVYPGLSERLQRYPYNQDLPHLHQKMYLVFAAYGSYSFVAEVYVNEIVLILNKKGTSSNTSTSRWYAIGGSYDPQTDPIAIPPENFDEWELVNTWFWVDEPVAGHAIYEHDNGVYPTLAAALAVCTPWKSIRNKKVQKALQRHRNNWYRGYRSANKEAQPEWSPIPKKTWVRRN